MRPGFLLALTLAFVVACGDSNDDNTCGIVETRNSEISRTVTISGNFPGSGDGAQPVISLFSPATQTLEFAATSYNENSATFLNLPAGSYQVEFYLSGCTDGQGRNPGLMVNKTARDITILP